MTPQIFAAIYTTAQKLREDSWKSTAHWTGSGSDAYVVGGGTYAKTYTDAAHEACLIHEQDEVWAQPIEFLMIGAWSDTADWAKEQGAKREASGT